MLKKIVSSGLPGASSAAIDLAIQLGMPYEGWKPPLFKDTSVHRQNTYSLKTASTKSYHDYINRNINDSDATLVFLTRQVPMECQIAKKMALKLKKFLLSIDLKTENAFAASRRISDWIVENNIATLYITGPEETISKGVYEKVRNILEASLFLNIMETNISHNQNKKTKRTKILIKNIDQAVNLLEKDLSLRNKSIIANMPESELASLHFSLGNYIREQFDIHSARSKIVESLNMKKGSGTIRVENIPATIIRNLWLTLKQKYRLRLIKT